MVRKSISLKEELKSLFRGYKHFTKKICHRLEELGFHMEAGKTHVKIYYGQCRSKFVTSSKTPSDHRAGLNLCSQLWALTQAAA